MELNLAISKHVQPAKVLNVVNSWPPSDILFPYLQQNLDLTERALSYFLHAVLHLFCD